MLKNTLGTVVLTAVITSGFAGTAASQAASGTAVVQVVTQPPGAPTTFHFTGVPAGTVSAGGTLEASGLAPGSFASTQVEGAPQVILVDITCDDPGSATPSVGDVLNRTATFNVEAGEVVTCVFTNTVQPSSGGPSTGAPAPASGGGGASGTNPFSSPDPDFDQFPVPDPLPPSAGTFSTPKAGPWDVSNFAGQMACTGVMSMTRPLSPSRDSGTLEVRDGGSTVIGKGLGDDTEDITVQRVPGLNGRYFGSVGGSQGGIPMTIDFSWQLVTDEWIVGYLTSKMSSQGMTCDMFRTFELRYAGN